MSFAAFWAMQVRSWWRIVGVGNCARRSGLGPKADMWTSAMREASDSVANVGSDKAMIPDDLMLVRGRLVSVWN